MPSKTDIMAGASSQCDSLAHFHNPPIRPFLINFALVSSKPNVIMIKENTDKYQINFASSFIRSDLWVKISVEDLLQTDVTLPDDVAN